MSKEFRENNKNNRIGIGNKNVNKNRHVSD